MLVPTVTEGAGEGSTLCVSFVVCVRPVVCVLADVCALEERDRGRCVEGVGPGGEFGGTSTRTHTRGRREESNMRWSREEEREGGRGEEETMRGEEGGEERTGLSLPTRVAALSTVSTSVARACSVCNGFV